MSMSTRSEIGVHHRLVRGVGAREVAPTNHAVHQVRGAALAGLASLVERHRVHRDMVHAQVREIGEHASHLYDWHGQSEAAEALFGAGAHALTVMLATKAEGLSRGRVRELLAVQIVALARQVVAAMDESGRDADEFILALRSRLDDPGDLGEQAAGFEAARPLLPGGYNSSEWAVLRTGPLLAVLHVSAAASNGPFGLIREYLEADNAVLSRALDATPPESVVGAIFHAGLCRRKLQEFANEYPSRQFLLGQLQRCLTLADKGREEDTQEYRAMIMAAADTAATAAKEPVLFSRRSELEAERRALDEIRRLTQWSAAS